MKCVMCSGKLKDSYMDVKRLKEGITYVFKNVPISKCSKCGDSYIDDQEIEKIDYVLNNKNVLLNIGQKIYIIDFKDIG